MAEEFVLDWKVDQPAVLAGRREEVFALITVRPNIAILGALLENVGNTALPAHLIVVVDVSGSMRLLIHDDPYAKSVSSATSEGQTVRVVESKVPSRLEVAIRTVEKLIHHMGPSDRMTLVAFDHESHPIAASMAAGTDLTNAIQGLADSGGGGTSMGRGLASVVSGLRGASQAGVTRKLVVLTDGEDQDVDLALEQARLIGEECHVPIYAFGTGECNVAFLTEICKTTLGGGFNNIVDEKDAARCFDEVLQGQKNTLATNVKLSLWLSPEILVQELYRTRPEILYRGKMSPGANNQIELNLEYMERNKVYEFLFRCEVPAREVGRFRIAKATLDYDIPALSLTGQKADANIVVEYTSDVERAQVRVGEVRRTVAQAAVQRQVLFLQEKRNLIEAGGATEQDKLMVSRLLDNLIQQFEEFGDQANRNSYVKVREEYRGNGTISQQTLNQSLAASSKVEQTVTVQDIDDF